MVSVTITDKSGRTLSGQMVEAFWNSVSHAPLLSVGINCALGAKEMRPYVEELSRIAPVFLSAYPNAGLPNAFGGFDETPEIMSAGHRRLRPRGMGEHRGRLLRHDARAHPRDRRRGEGAAPAADPRSRAPHPPLGPRAVHAPPRGDLHARGRADERHRVAEVRRSSSSRATTRARSPWRASRSTAARTSST